MIICKDVIKQCPVCLLLLPLQSKCKVNAKWRKRPFCSFLSNFAL